MSIDPALLAKAKTWTLPPYDDATRKQVERMIAEGGTDLVDSFYRDLEFGTGGLRGVMGAGSNRMNVYTVATASQGYATYLKKQFPEGASVAIAHDSRNNSPLFAHTAADVFTANGIKTFLFKALRPTPELSFAIRHLKCQGGVVVTASHNPKEYNGYKVYWNDGAQVVPPHDKAIIQCVQAIRTIDEVKRQGDPSLLVEIGEEIDQVYVEKLAGVSVNPSIIHKHESFPIVYTPIHGTGGTVTPRALARFGFKNVRVLESQAEPSGDFPTVHSPNPEEKEALALAVAEAEKTGAELVLATDPDADRVGIAVRDESGQFTLLNGNQTATLLLYYLLSAWKKAGKLTGKEYVVKTIVTTELLAKMAKNFGVEYFDVLTGFKYIAEIMRENEGKKTFIGGGEESYGYLAGDFVRDKDAVMSCCLIAEMAVWAKDQGLSPWQLLQRIYVEFGCFKEALISITKKGKSGQEEIAAMMTDLRKNPPKSLAGSPVVRFCDYGNRVETDASGKTKPIDLPKSDVLQFHLADGSVVTARPSGTEPKIKFYFGAAAPLASEKDFAKVWSDLDGKIKTFQRELRLV